jgi:hypothetical protein
MTSRLDHPLLLLAFVLAAAPSVAGAPVQAPARPATDVGGPVAPGTVWTRDASPYVTTATVTVPPSVTLTIEPGVTVHLGSFHDLDVRGGLSAVGTADAPIVLDGATSGAWGSVIFAAGSGPSELAHATVTGGGAARRPMVNIASDDAVVRDTLFTAAKGFAVLIRDGASPALRDNRFFGAVDPTVNPPVALRIMGPSDATITGNFFQSNVQAVMWDANANPTFTGNRFEGNGSDGVLVSGKVSRDVTLRSLGPRLWPYHIITPGIEIDPGATLTIGAGATLRLATSGLVRVRGTLVVSGTASAKVLFSDESAHTPGQWRDIRFEDESVDYDPATGAGSIIAHAIVEYGGSNPTGMIHVLNSAPRITNTTVRGSHSSGVGVRGAAATPELVAVTFEDCATADTGAGLHVIDGATPVVSFSLFQRNLFGVRIEGAGKPRLGPHNRFVDNGAYAAYNADPLVCVDATGNDWGGAGGPLDQSAGEDACGQGSNEGNGGLVSDHIRYGPWEGQLSAPVLQAPRCGTSRVTSPEIAGIAPAGVDVVVYDNQTEIGRVTAEGGGSEPARFRLAPPALSAGSHVLQAQSVRGDQSSGLSEPLGIFVDPDAVIDPSNVTVSYDLDGTRFVQPYLGEGGCFSPPGDGGWRVQPIIGPRLTLAAPISCPGGGSVTAGVTYLGARHAMGAASDGRLEASFDQSTGGALGIEVTCGDQTVTIDLGTVNPDAYAYVHDAVHGPIRRVASARLTLLAYVPSINNYVVWDARTYYGQTNPQTTGTGGWYAFYPPPGTYRLQVDAPGYRRYLSPARTIGIEPIMGLVPVDPVIAGTIYLPAARRSQ